MVIRCNIKSAPMNIETLEVGHKILFVFSTIIATYSSITDVPTSAQNQFAWHPSGELHMSMGTSTGSVPLDTRWVQCWYIDPTWKFRPTSYLCVFRAHKDDRQDDVEVMSTDSSSSSSSDSQWFSQYHFIMNKRIRRHFSNFCFCITFNTSIANLSGRNPLRVNDNDFKDRFGYSDISFLSDFSEFM